MSNEFPELKGKAATFVKSILPVIDGKASDLPDHNTMPVWCFDLANLETKEKEMMKNSKQHF